MAAALISLHFIVSAFVVVIAPGTGVLYTLAVALGRGRRAAIAAAFGCTLGILPHLTAAALGLAAALHASAVLFTTVKYAGVAYLLWLAWSTLREGGALRIDSRAEATGLVRVAWRGALLNILNPKLSVFFLALLPPFLSGAPETATMEIAGLGAVFMMMTFGVFVLYGLFAAAARDMVLASDRAMRWLNRAFAATFAALGLRLAAERA